MHILRSGTCVINDCATMYRRGSTIDNCRLLDGDEVAVEELGRGGETYSTAVGEARSADEACAAVVWAWGGSQMTWMVGYGEGNLNSRASFFLILCKLVKVGLAQSSTPRGEATRRRANFRDRRWGLAGAEADRGGQQSSCGAFSPDS